MSWFCCNKYLIDDVIKSKKEHSKRNNLNVEFLTKGFLKANMKIHVFISKCQMFWWHGYAWRARENKQFKCRVCDKDFAQKKPMMRHVFTVNNLHPDSKMFSCHNYAGIINQLCRKDWRRNTIRKSTRPRVLNAIIATNFFFFSKRPLPNCEFVRGHRL